MGAPKKQQDSHESKNIQHSDSNQDSVLAILEFMNNYAEKVNYSEEKNFVFVLGNTGAGMLIREIRTICSWCIWVKLYLNKAKQSIEPKCCSKICSLRLINET